MHISGVTSVTDCSSITKKKLKRNIEIQNASSVLLSKSQGECTNFEPNLKLNEVKKEIIYLVKSRNHTTQVSGEFQT